MPGAPSLKDLVLVGGGHAHVHVLKSFGMRPMPGIRLTLVGQDIETPYSGMIPGFVAGAYSFEQCHIDLARLATFAGARLLHAEATGIDRNARRIMLRGRPPLAYDILSLDIGSKPSLGSIPGADAHATPVKPIAQLGRRWCAFLDSLRDRRTPLRVTIVGGGAGGVELALAIEHRLRRVTGLAQLAVTLITAGEVLPGQATAARRRMRQILRDRVLLIEHDAVASIEPDAVTLASGNRIPSDDTFVVTEASAHAWFAATGLALDAHGFIAIGPTLRSANDEYIFAAGDCATVLAHPRPKAGVFAVRQGPPLAENLRRALLRQQLKPFRPQPRGLSIIGTADGRALATRGAWAAEGRWAWLWKDWIDRRWMRRYRELPQQMGTAAAPDPALVGADTDTRRLLADFGMRCGGCGAKVGATTLANVLVRLGATSRPGVALGLDSPDDAALIEVPPGKALVQSVDFFRAFIDDPFVFGEIAAIHALGDVWAMGAQPHSALALAIVPAAAERLMEEDLFQMLAGARAVLDAAGCTLIGGHSGEGPEAALGFSVNGLVDPARALRKGGLRDGDRLVLTKPLGTGVIFAAAMRGASRASWIDGALASMRRPSGESANRFVALGAHACTDVTGFGLVGHIVEMVRATTEHVTVELSLDALPVLAGAAELFANGYASSLQPENLRARHLIDGMARRAAHPKLALLFDPQTAGGLIAALPPRAAAAAIEQLRAEGIDATEIGTVRGAENSEPPAFISI